MRQPGGDQSVPLRNNPADGDEQVRSLTFDSAHHGGTAGDDDAFRRAVVPHRTSHATQRSRASADHVIYHQRLPRADETVIVQRHNDGYLWPMHDWEP